MAVSLLLLRRVSHWPSATETYNCPDAEAPGYKVLLNPARGLPELWAALFFYLFTGGITPCSQHQYVYED